MTGWLAGGLAGGLEMLLVAVAVHAEPTQPNTRLSRSPTCSFPRYHWHEWTKRVNPDQPQRVTEPFTSELRPGSKPTKIDLTYKASMRVLMWHSRRVDST